MSMQNINILKRVGIAFVLTMGVVVNSVAQNAFHVYRNDGSINTFFYSYLDSITYSGVAVDGNDATEAFVQNFHTPDTTYSIPVSTIDSVSFYRPATVYKTGVIRLEEKHFPYISGRDGLVLKFNGNMPKELLPKKGDKLVTLEMNETFPSGFAGEVTGVSTDAGNYVVECELPMLTDMFESYYYDGNIELYETEKKDVPQQHAMNKAPGDAPCEIWPPVDEYFTLPTAKRDLNVFDFGLSAGPAAGSVSQTLSWTLESQMHLRTSLLICGGMSFHVIMTGKHSLTTDISTSVSGSVEAHRGSSVSVRPPAAPLIEFYMEYGPFFKFSGSLNGKYHQTQYFNSVLKYSYDQGSPTNVPNELRIVPQGRDEPEGEITGGVTLEVGAYMEMGMAIGSREIAKVGLAYERGIRLDAEINLSDAPSVSSPPDTSVYDKHKGENLLNVSLFEGVELRLKALYAEASSGVERSIGAPLFQCGMVPDFDKVETGMSKDGIGELYATADVSRRCLGNSRVGFALYQNDKLIDKQYYGTPYDGSTPLHISNIFKGLTPGLKYKVYPMVELFGNSELLATPSSDVELEVGVTTGASADISDASATLSGTVSGIDENTECKYGIAYRTAENETWTESIYSGKGGGNFSCRIDGLLPETEYLYRAFLCVEDNYFYGDQKSFKTGKKDNTAILKEGLKYFYETANGSNWTNNTGWLKSDNINSWYGVSAFGDNNLSLKLPDNNLSGDAVLKNTKLSELDLRDNPLSSLTIVDGSISIPKYLLPPLKKLQINNCNISSMIGNPDLVSVKDMIWTRGELTTVQDIVLNGCTLENNDISFCNLKSNTLSFTDVSVTAMDPMLDYYFKGSEIDNVSISNCLCRNIGISGGVVYGLLTGPIEEPMSKIGTLSLNNATLERFSLYSKGELSALNLNKCMIYGDLDFKNLENKINMNINDSQALDDVILNDLNAGTLTVNNTEFRDVQLSKCNFDSLVVNGIRHDCEILIDQGTTITDALSLSNVGNNNYVHVMNEDGKVGKINIGKCSRGLTFAIFSKDVVDVNVRDCSYLSLLKGGWMGYPDLPLNKVGNLSLNKVGDVSIYEGSISSMNVTDSPRLLLSIGTEIEKIKEINIEKSQAKIYDVRAATVTMNSSTVNSINNCNIDNLSINTNDPSIHITPDCKISNININISDVRGGTMQIDVPSPLKINVSNCNFSTMEEKNANCSYDFFNLYVDKIDGYKIPSEYYHRVTPIFFSGTIAQLKAVIVKRVEDLERADLGW